MHMRRGWVECSSDGDGLSGGISHKDITIPVGFTDDIVSFVRLTLKTYTLSAAWRT